MIAALGLGTALGSALAAATSTVLQHRSARAAPTSQSKGILLIGHLLARPIWLAGLLAAGVGLVLHAIALAHGELVVVQPLLVCGVVFALPVSVALEGHRPTAGEVGWAFLLVGGLSAFLLAGDAHGGRIDLDADVLALTSSAGVLAAVVVAIVAWSWARQHTALLLAIAAGIGYGVSAALLKQVVALADRGIEAEFVDWPIFTLAAVGAGTVWLTQHAYHAGPLAQSMPALTVTDPAVSILIGALAFHEQLADEPLAVIAQVMGFLAMVAAIVILARISSNRPQAATRSARYPNAQ